MIELKYLPPNLVTALRLSITMVVLASIYDGNHQQAAFWILATIVIDMLDGFLATVLDATSRFGHEFDAQTDVVNFGVAPAFLLYSTGLETLGTVGIVIGMVPIVLTTVRASMFIVQDQDGIIFRGLAMPSSALVLLGTVFWDMHIAVMVVITLITSSLMVSQFQYFKIRGVMVLGATILFLIVALFFPQGLMVIGFAYALHGPIYVLLKGSQ